MKRDDWETPKKLFDFQDDRFDFNIDVAASAKNKLCENFYSKKNSFLTKYKGHPEDRIWCNPPYSLAKEFSEFCWHVFDIYGIPSYLLLPVRSDRIWYQELLHSKGVRNEPYTGRIHFGGSGAGAFMYNIGVVIGFSEVPLLPWLDAGQFNDGEKGSAKS